MEQELAEGQCVPCRGGVPPLKGRELQEMYEKLRSGWSVVDEHHLEKEYRFKNFREALTFTNRVSPSGLGQGQGAGVDAQDRRPDLERLRLCRQDGTDRSRVRGWLSATDDVARLRSPAVDPGRSILRPLRRFHQHYANSFRW
jgi:hypothetical protein